MVIFVTSLVFWMVGGDVEDLEVIAEDRFLNKYIQYKHM